MDSKTIQQLIESGLPGANVAVSGNDGVHFEAVVIAPQFKGKSMLQRHRMVYSTLGDAMGHAIHALSLDTRVPDETGGG